MPLARVERVGSVYSRMSFLVRHGAIRAQYKPLWLDVYEAFPPKYEPRYDRKAELDGTEVPKILYKEDAVRARFYRQFGERHEVYRMNDNAEPAASQRFVKAYEQEMESSGGADERELFTRAVDKLEAEGLHLRQMDPEAARKGLRDRGASSGSRSASEGQSRRSQQSLLVKQTFAELFSTVEAENKAGPDADAKSEPPNPNNTES